MISTGLVSVNKRRELDVIDLWPEIKVNNEWLKFNSARDCHLITC